MTAAPSAPVYGPPDTATGLAFATVSVVCSVPKSLSSSVTLSVRVKAPSSVQVTFAFFRLALSKVQTPPASIPAVVTVHRYVNVSLLPASVAVPLSWVAGPRCRRCTGRSRGPPAPRWPA